MTIEILTLRFPSLNAARRAAGGAADWRVCDQLDALARFRMPGQTWRLAEIGEVIAKCA